MKTVSHLDNNTKQDDEFCSFIRLRVHAWHLGVGHPFRTRL